MLKDVGKVAHCIVMCNSKNVGINLHVNQKLNFVDLWSTI